jgi:hypothetical protein
MKASEVKRRQRIWYRKERARKAAEKRRAASVQIVAERRGVGVQVELTREEAFDRIRAADARAQLRLMQG